MLVEVPKSLIIANLQAFAALTLYSPKAMRFFSYCQTSHDTVSLTCDQWHSRQLRAILPRHVFPRKTIYWRALQVCRLFLCSHCLRPHSRVHRCFLTQPPLFAARFRTRLRSAKAT
jgi:hypothetical protein